MNWGYDIDYKKAMCRLNIQNTDVQLINVSASTNRNYLFRDWFLASHNHVAEQEDIC